MIRRLLLLSALTALTGCGTSREGARDEATDHGCGFYERCGEIGSGKRYADRDACEVGIRAGWDDLWPSADCDGKINREALDFCLVAIDATACNSALDFFNTIVNKCGKGQVCSGG